MRIDLGGARRIDLVGAGRIDLVRALRIDLGRVIRAALRNARPNLATLVLASLITVDHVHAQSAGTVASPLVVDEHTTVGSVGFRFGGSSVLSTKRLRDNIAYSGPGSLRGLREALDWVPGISAPELPRFSPLTLQRDVARLRRVYRRAGFHDVAIDYEVALDASSNEIDVTFLVEPGAPVRLGAVEVGLVRADGPFVMPEELADAWTGHRRRLDGFASRPYGDELRAQIEAETTDWFLRRGYPWARAGVAAADTVDGTASVALQVTPGPRARVDSIAIEGRTRLADHVVRREIPIAVGDYYDAAAVSAGQRELYELDIVRRALGGLVEEQPPDSTVTLRFRIDESKPRLVWGRAGWRSEAGVAAEAHWSHRDFLGGARTLTTSGNVETGWGAVEQASGRSVGLSAQLRQPYLWHRRISGSMGPFVRFRDDFRDRSLLFGLESLLVYRWGALKTVSFQHELSRNRIDDAFQLLPVAELAMSGDSTFAPVFVQSVFRIRGSFGALDDRLSPRSGFLVEPSAEFTAPAGSSDVDYVRVALEALVALPLSDDVEFVLRGSAGRLFPLGDSDPLTSPTPTRAVVGLRNAMFTAGGTSSLRGWGRALAGPKMPEVSVDADGAVWSDRYIPVGGLARSTVSGELGLPFLATRHRTYLFFDAGRVWNPRAGFDPVDPELALDPWMYAVGGGLQFTTVAGPVRLGVGYKLNPTLVDLLSPGQVASALASGGSLASLPTEAYRRWHLHISIGRGL